MEAEAIQLLAWLVAGVGVLLLVGYLAQVDDEWWRKQGVRVRGGIVRNEFHLGRTSVSRPVVRFTTTLGQVIEAEYPKGWATAIPRYSAGRAVWVAYNKTNPFDFVLLSPGDILG